MFGQQFELFDIVLVLVLVVLEGLLSVDNALVLGMLARRLPKHQQGRALTWGLVGAFVFRLIAVATASTLMRWHVVKFLGGLYLVYISVKFFLFEMGSEAEEAVVEGADGQPTLVEAATGKPLTAEEMEEELEARSIAPVPEATETSGAETSGKKYANFWWTVGSIELTDIAFAVDSILAAIAFVGENPKGPDATHPKLWVVFTGGFLGVILMRFAAKVFIRLLEKFPRFEIAAYLLVIVIGAKLLLEYFFNTPEFAAANPDHPYRIDFHSPRGLPFWLFWGSMAVAFAIGFIPKKEEKKSA